MRLLTGGRGCLEGFLAAMRVGEAMEDDAGSCRVTQAGGPRDAEPPLFQVCRWAWDPAMDHVRAYCG